MKLEFTFSIVLLAGGCLLWNISDMLRTGADPSHARPLTQIKNDSLPATKRTVSLAAFHQTQSTVPLAAGQKTDDQHSDSPESPSVAAESIPEARPASPNPFLPSAQQLLQQSASNLFHSTPIRSAARLRINLFGQKFVADGSYLQMGQGSGRTKLEFVFGTPDRPSRLLQVCDGRFHYSLASNSETSSLEFVDLLQVADADHQQLIASPSTWMTTGGLPGLLQNAANAFEFQPVQQSQLGDIPVFHVRGKWNKEFLKRIFGDSVNQDWIEDSMQWHRLPVQLPHMIEIYLGNDSFFPLFPYKIEFLQLQKNDEGTNLKKVFTFEMYEVDKLAEISDELFRIDYQNITPYDVTDEFIRRIEQINRPAQTANRVENPTHR